MFFSILPKLVLIFIFLKYFIILFNINLKFLGLILLICGIFSLCFGGLNAFFQYNLKRFLAYSAIANLGYILLAFSLCNIDGYISGFFYLVTYLLSLITLFYFIINNRDLSNKKINDIFDFSLIYNSNKVLAVFFAFIFFSLGGIPPLMGFFGKFFVFISFANNFNYLVFMLILIITIFIAFYYIRVVRFLFFNNNVGRTLYVTYNTSLVFSFLFLINILFLFIIDFIVENINIFAYSFSLIF